MRRAEHVVLINPPSPWLISDRDLPPLGLLYLAASLREHGVSVEVCDLAGEDVERSVIPTGDLYGIGFTTPQYGVVKRLVDMLACRQNAYIVLGGPHCSALPVRTQKELEPDLLLAGEADWSLVDFVQGRDKAAIPGAVYWDLERDGWNVNPLPVVPFDMLPMPARDLVYFDDYAKIKTFTSFGCMREASVITARGCPYDCAFCGQRCITGGRVRYRTVQQVVDEVRLLKYRYGVDQVNFVDDTFNLDMFRVADLCERLKGMDVVWHCLARADRFTLDTAQRLYEGGCRSVTFGFESGSDRILAAMNKHLTARRSLEAAVDAKAAGLAVRAQMIVGFPGETDETVEETAAFVRRAPVDKWGFHIFAPLPGSPAWHDPEAYGLELDKEAVDFEHGFTTIGRPGEWDETLVVAKEWLNHLTAVAKGRNTYEGVAKCTP